MNGQDEEFVWQDLEKKAKSKAEKGPQRSGSWGMLDTWSPRELIPDTRRTRYNPSPGYSSKHGWHVSLTLKSRHELPSSDCPADLTQTA